MSYASLGNSTLFAIFLKWPVITVVAAGGLLIAANNTEQISDVFHSIKTPAVQQSPSKPITVKATA